MRILRSLLFALPALFILGCEEPETAPATTADITVPRTEEQTDVSVAIQGAGTVEFDRPDILKIPPKCTAPDGNGMHCDVMRFEGNAAVTATPADGWRFVRWEVAPATVAPIVITDPSARTQSIPKGDMIFLVAVFESIVHPIKATFIEEAMATQYVIDIDALGASLSDEAGISVQWSGPTCGDFEPSAEQLGTTGRSYAMTWHHPHPPCDATSDHHDVTIRATIRINEQTIVCEYGGAKSGEGQPCK
jgi:hypothetical protein